ncbi:hypothetical protein ROTAS13_00560 [Roseomonas sp. TAS13]|nr:hypothetical protein ROTAS13_00560 [Roseomonas sp. TAS13]
MNSCERHIITRKTYQTYFGIIAFDLNRMLRGSTLQCSETGKRAQSGAPLPQMREIEMNTFREMGESMILAHEGQRQLAEMLFAKLRNFFSHIRAARSAADAVYR